MRDMYVPDAAAAEEARMVRETLQRKVRESGKTYREIEERAGMGRDYLRQVLRGSVHLKVAHLLAVLRALELPPAAFFAEAYGELPSPAALRAQEERHPSFDETVRVLKRSTLRLMLRKCMDDGLFSEREAEEILDTLDEKKKDTA